MWQQKQKILTASESNSAPENPLTSQMSTALPTPCGAVVDDKSLQQSIISGPLPTPLGLLSCSTLKWPALCKYFPLGPLWVFSFSLRIFSSDSRALFCSTYLSASAKVRQPAIRASWVQGLNISTTLTCKLNRRDCRV